MKLLILGCGRVGATLANIMNKGGHEVTVIDLNTESFDRLGSDFSGNTILGDGTDEDVLIRAGIESAEAFAAVTNGDNRNILAAQIAKHTFGVPKVICRIYDPIRQETYNALGLESISPTVVGAKHPDEIAQVLQWRRAPIPAALWTRLRKDGFIVADAPTSAES